MTLSFNLFEMNTVGHISQGLWRHPDNTRDRYTDLTFWQSEAKLLEEGLFDTVFLADVIGAYDSYRGGPETAVREAVQIPNNDPLLLIPAMAAVTDHLGFVATFSTTYEPPFAFARRASTLDHLTNGRFGWNVVTSYLPNAARNFGLADELSHEQRYDRAHEYLDVLYKLWEGSWEDGAVVRDAAGAVYTDPAKVHRIDHDGEYFRVAGPHLSEPSPQRTPVIFQAGSSPTGRAFAAQHAEVVFVGGTSLVDFATSISDIRNRAEDNGRGRDAVRTLGSAVLIPGKTHADAERKAEEYERYSSAQGYLAYAGGGSGIDLAAYPADTLMTDVIARSRSPKDAATMARYAPGSTVGEALRERSRISWSTSSPSSRNVGSTAPATKTALSESDISVRAARACPPRTSAPRTAGERRMRTRRNPAKLERHIRDLAQETSARPPVIGEKQFRARLCVRRRR